MSGLEPEYCSETTSSPVRSVRTVRCVVWIPAVTTPCDLQVGVAGRRTRRRFFGRGQGKSRNVEWANNSTITPQLFTAASQLTELVPDAMSGLILAPDFLVKRIVGTFLITPQPAATATSTIALAIFRSEHNAAGALTTSINPLDVDVDSGSADILWQWQGQPQYGAKLDATALDLAFELKVDIKAKGALRKLDKRHGIQLVFRAETTARVQFTHRLRILSGISA